MAFVVRKALSEGLAVLNSDEMGSLIPVGDFAYTSRRSAVMRRVRLRSRGVYVGDDTVLCWVLGRYKFYIQASDVGFGAHIMLDGYWEMWVTEFVARCVAPGMTAFDLGANFGYFTLLLADLVGPQGKVLAIEANPSVAGLLRHNIAVNGFADRVIVDERAAWHVTGETLFFEIADNEPKNAHVTTVRPDPAPGVAHVPVTTFALDDLADQKVDFIKADIEGAEEHVWNGMQRLLARNPDMIFLLEFAASRCANPRGVLDQMAALFPLQYLDHESRVLPITAEQVLEGSEWMLVLTRRALPPLL